MKHFFQRNHKMPKTGPLPATWLQRLREYAQGTFQFERGQRPGKNSYWAKRLETIEKCAKHKNPGNQDALGRRITCVCGFHTPRRPAQQVKTFTTASSSHRMASHGVDLSKCYLE